MRAPRSFRLGAGACCLLAAIAGCEGETLIVAEGLGFGASDTAGGVPPMEDRCARPIEQRALESTCWPTLHVGQWRGLVTGRAGYWGLRGARLQYPSGAVRLSVSPSGQADLRFEAAQPRPASAPPFELDASVLRDAGTLPDAGAAATRDAMSPAVPVVWSEEEVVSPCSGEATDARCGNALTLVSGYPYTASSLLASGGPASMRTQDPFLQFDFRLGEPMAAWCEAQLPDEACAEAAVLDAGPTACPPRGFALAESPCTCTPTQCTSLDGWFRAQLRLSANGNALRGQIVQRDSSDMPAGIELVRTEAPP